MSITVIRPGLLSTIQDGGRPGHAALGVGRAGAMDTAAWRIANALVGNDADAAALECTLVGPTLTFDAPALIALTGAPIAAHVEHAAIPCWTPCVLPAGATLRLGGMARGCRSYLAVRGGIGVDPVLGSRSCDLHAGIGPPGGRALRSGDRLPVGRATPCPAAPGVDAPRAARWSVDAAPWFDTARRRLDLIPGSHSGALDDASRARLHGAPLRIGKDSNRTGTRLEGARLTLRTPLELISEAALPGTVQLPPSGQPIILLAEAPVTGGYPRIGQLAAVDLPRLAQLRPGDDVAFRATTMAVAMARRADHAQRLDRLVAAITARVQGAAGPCG